MHIILATGIYPPDIGGPATYVRALAQALKSRGADVTVVSYGSKTLQETDESWTVHRVSRRWPVLRWFRYASVLKKVGHDADIVYAFSSVSAGVPLWISGLHATKRVLRLGGDFLWERYTASGGRMTLREWHESVWFSVSGFWLRWLIARFDHIVFSTAFQAEMYERYYSSLPAHSVIENALPTGNPQLHRAHQPFRLLFLGRFVGFKNLPALIHAVCSLHSVTLTLVGEGPMRSKLMKLSKALNLGNKVQFRPPVTGADKRIALLEHDVLVLPSITEISPNVALEARAMGLPVLLSKHTGLSDELTRGMTVASLVQTDDIIRSIHTMIGTYDAVALQAASSLSARNWDTVGGEHMQLFGRLCSHSSENAF